MHGVGNFCWIYVWNNCGDINFSCEKFRLTGNIFLQDDDIETYDVIDVNDKTIKTTLVNMLRDELKKKEPNRDFLRFRYRGEICDGVPISEINPSKFIFKIDDKLRGVNLSEIKIL